MASMTFGYKGLHFDPPVLHETGFGTATFMMKLEEELRERGEVWFSDGKSNVLDAYRLSMNLQERR